MIEMQRHRHFGRGGQTARLTREDHRVGIFEGAGRGLNDHGRMLRFGGCHDGLHHFHVLGVKRADGVFPLLSLLQHFSG